jgi:OsmC-like protein
MVRQSHAARVRLPPGDAEAASATSHIVVRHHRTPQAEWSIDLATGGHVLHLALAQCVFNNVLRIAGDRGLLLTDLTVVADGDFNADGTASTGIECSIELGGDANRSVLTSVAEAAFMDSTVAAVLRRGGTVELASVRASGRDAGAAAE